MNTNWAPVHLDTIIIIDLYYLDAAGIGVHERYPRRRLKVLDLDKHLRDLLRPDVYQRA